MGCKSRGGSSPLRRMTKPLHPLGVSRVSGGLRSGRPSGPWYHGGTSSPDRRLRPKPRRRGGTPPEVAVQVERQPSRRPRASRRRRHVSRTPRRHGPVVRACRSQRLPRPGGAGDNRRGLMTTRGIAALVWGRLPGVRRRHARAARLQRRRAHAGRRDDAGRLERRHLRRRGSRVRHRRRDRRRTGAAQPERLDLLRHGDRRGRRRPGLAVCRPGRVPRRSIRYRAADRRAIQNVTSRRASRCSG